MPSVDFIAASFHCCFIPMLLNSTASFHCWNLCTRNWSRKNKQPVIPDEIHVTVDPVWICEGVCWWISHTNKLRLLHSVSLCMVTHCNCLKAPFQNFPICILAQCQISADFNGFQGCTFYCSANLYKSFMLLHYLPTLICSFDFADDVPNRKPTLKINIAHGI